MLKGQSSPRKGLHSCSLLTFSCHFFLCHCLILKPYNAIHILTGKLSFWYAGGADKLAGFVSSCCLPFPGLPKQKGAKPEARACHFWWQEVWHFHQTSAFEGCDSHLTLFSILHMQRSFFGIAPLWSPALMREILRVLAWHVGRGTVWIQAVCHRGHRVTPFVLALLGALSLRPAAPVAPLWEPGLEDCVSVTAGGAPCSGGCSCVQRSVPGQAVVLRGGFFWIWSLRCYLVVIQVEGLPM